jgi:exo-beta-1,3-glucanase (GH17 family)
MRNLFYLLILVLICTWSCVDEKPIVEEGDEVTAPMILGDPEYRAISYGGYRKLSRDTQPSLDELMEDMRLLSAAGIKLIRTYNVTRPHAANTLKAIERIKEEDPSFEMYVMLGAWIDCKGAFTDEPDHTVEDTAANTSEIERAIGLAQAHPDIVKIIAVGNEAMVHWQAPYFVPPGVILKYVRYLQDQKNKGALSKDLWITSSDNFASWGGGGEEYHLQQLDSLIMAVDFVSMHTYPMHDTHYNPDFWGVLESEKDLSDSLKIAGAMQRSLEYAQMQFESTSAYIARIDSTKPVHIGETGWATESNSHYGPDGSKACDEYKSGIFHRLMRDWTDQDSITCFYFVGFDEIWKDAKNPGGSENHFGLFDIDGQAKYAIWDLVDAGAFEGLSRGGNEIRKTFNGDFQSLMETVEVPPMKKGEKE